MSVGGPAPVVEGPAPGALERPDFEVVPLKALPIVAIVLAGLIAAIAANRLWPLEFFHVVAGAAWTILTEIGMLSPALIVAGGIYLAAHLPQHVPLGPAIGLLAASALLLAGNLIALARVPGFPWRRFLEIARWALLAYAVTAAIIEYASCATISAAARWWCSRSRWWSTPSTSRR